MPLGRVVAALCDQILGQRHIMSKATSTALALQGDGDQRLDGMKKSQRSGNLCRECDAMIL
jgi:hypothetical protein